MKERNSQENILNFLHEDLRTHERVSIEKFQNNNFKRGLQEGEEAFPVISKIGPYVVKNPVFGAKNYHWCSCGMSKSQPFCDSSHKGTVFNPLKFSLEQPATSMYLCGCKLSSQAPFCDGITCQKLLKGEEFQFAEAYTESEDQEEEEVGNEQQDGKQEKQDEEKLK